MRVLLLGGTSEIGLAVLRRLARARPEGRGVELHLAGRDVSRMEAELAAWEQSGRAAGHVTEIDARDTGTHRAAIRHAFAQAGGFDLVVLAVGLLGAQAGIDAPRQEAIDVMAVNFVGCGSLLLESANCLRDAGAGTLVVLSSVAAERPRAANAVYGAAKAGLDALAQGVGDSLAGSGARIIVIRPGFVTTRMTQGLKPPPFSTTPEAVADATVAALDSGAHTVWVPRVLRLVFAVLRHLPRPIYRRLPL